MGRTGRKGQMKPRVHSINGQRVKDYVNGKFVLEQPKPKLNKDEIKRKYENKPKFGQLKKENVGRLSGGTYRNRAGMLLSRK